MKVATLQTLRVTKGLTDQTRRSVLHCEVFVDFGDSPAFAGTIYHHVNCCKCSVILLTVGRSQLERETDRQTDRQTDRERETETQRQAERQRERQTQRETQRETETDKQRMRADRF